MARPACILSDLAFLDEDRLKLLTNVAPVAPGLCCRQSRGLLPVPAERICLTPEPALFTTLDILPARL